MVSNFQGLLEELVKEKIPKNFNLLGRASKQTLNLNVAEVSLIILSNRYIKNCIAKCGVNVSVGLNSDQNKCLENCTYKSNAMLEYLERDYQNIFDNKVSYYLY